MNFLTLPPVHHLIRAWFWPAMIPVVFLLGWQNSVVIVFLYSTYANFTGDLGAYEGAKARQQAEKS